MDFSTDLDLSIVANIAAGRRFAGDAGRRGSEAPTDAVKVQKPRGGREGVTRTGSGRPLYRQGVEVISRNKA